MISKEKYVELVEEVLHRNIADNESQKEAILSSSAESQYIVAGPGSGKTTVLVLKILKYYFVDDISFDEMIVTTFTKKAAGELRERTILWTKMLYDALDMEVKPDFDKLVIGTLDSITEEFVCSGSDVEVIDNFTSSALMMQTLLTDERNTDKKLKQFLKRLKHEVGGVNTSEMNNQIKSIRERVFYDLIDYDLLEQNATKEVMLFNILNDYNDKLSQRKILDYPALEFEFYNILSNSRIDKLNNLKVLLIDEYQDTNYLQEQIYFNMARYVKENKGNITVVGDDDQSLYHFRGATIGLFTDYPSRLNKSLSIQPKTIFLKRNYRSTRNIINFANEFIHFDKKYVSSRSKNKPLIECSSSCVDGLPVMGLFRNNMEELSTDLSNLIYDLKVGNKTTITRHGKKYDLSLKKDNPSIALLTNSPKEINAFNKKRLPYYIRETLSYKDEDIVVFNPRGQIIETTEIVSLICGLILVTIDYKGHIESTLDNIPPHTKKTLKLWRKYIQDYISEQEKEITPCDEYIDLAQLLEDIKKECANLIKDSHENNIYYDLIIETITQTIHAISSDNLLSANQIFWHILVPIASGAIDVDDDMFDVNLDENVNIMSIHQSKGLEFDIVIVDVGSDIYNNGSSSAFKRFPKNGGKTYNIEKYLDKYSTVSHICDENTGLDYAFNDLIRKYFVAYTRAKSILILVGLNSMRYGFNGDFQKGIKIPNVATGWSRDNVWHWENLDNLLNI